MIHKNIAVFAALAMTGCNGGKDSADTDTNTGLCDVTATAEYPINDQTDAYYRSAIEFELSDPDDTATITLADSAGASVDGSVSLEDDGELVVFTPSASLAPSSGYTATLSWCGGEATISFTTSALGTPTEVDLTGRTYNVDITSGRFIEPAGVGDLLGGLLENSILLGVTAVDTDAGSISFRGAISETGNSNQDVCTPSLNDFPSASFADPYFNLAADQLDLAVAGFELSIASINIGGTFAADGSYFGGGELSGELDARELLPLLKEQELASTADEICDLLLGFGVACQACATDGEVYCASIVVDQLVAVEQSGEVAEVNQDDCFEGCVESCDNAECKDASTFAVCN
ncbi:MAG: hypothetical protein ACI8S6_002974 [Myxococcota bacterium]|jgi:hypothetical protein